MNISKTNRGFTLIEVLIAGAILVLAGVSAILLERQAINSSAFNKHKLQALGLAQEGINGTRAKFYSNLLDDRQGDDLWIGLGGANPNPDPANPTVYKLENGQLMAAPNGETFTQNNITFTRKIYIEKPAVPPVP